jgi:hypothetical protein
MTAHCEQTIWRLSRREIYVLSKHAQGGLWCVQRRPESGNMPHLLAEGIVQAVGTSSVNWHRRVLTAPFPHASVEGPDRPPNGSLLISDEVSLSWLDAGTTAT